MEGLNRFAKEGRVTITQMSTNNGCDNCGEQYTGTTTGRTFLTDHETADQIRTCGVLEETDDGDVTIRLFYHTFEDLADEIPAESIDDASIDPSSLTGDHRVVYQEILDATASLDKNTILLGKLRARVMKYDISPDECGDIVSELIASGVVVELDDGVLQGTKPLTVS